MAGILLAISGIVASLFYFIWVSEAIRTTHDYAWPTSKVDKSFIRVQIKKILYLNKTIKN